jgi:hypothetical protein
MAQLAWLLGITFFVIIAGGWIIRAGLRAGGFEDSEALEDSQLEAVGD